MNALKRYVGWLHTRWPAGRVEKLPLVDDQGKTNIPGVYIVGDLRGVPLLKFSVNDGARAVRHILQDRSFQSARADRDAEKTLDLVIVGAGVSGVSAAVEATVSGLSFKIVEATEPFSTVVNFPKKKPIFTYPTGMTPASVMQVTADVKEDLVAELKAQAAAHGIEPVMARVERVRPRGKHVEVVLSDGESLVARRVILALGRSGNFRRLGVPGEHLDKVYNRLHDPGDFRGQEVLVVGGGDSALETAIALALQGAIVTLVHRGKDLARAKAANLEHLRTLGGDIDLLAESNVIEIRERHVAVRTSDGQTRTVPNDVVFVMIGREAPLDFLRRSGIRIKGEWTKKTYLAVTGFVLFCVALYNWKSGGFLGNLFYQRNWFPVSLGTAFADAEPSSFPAVLAVSASGPAFWYTLAYSTLVVVFGIRRIRRRRTPYVTAQTVTLMAIQVLPLFLLPELVLPWLDRNGLLWQPLADALFPAVDYGHGREFWRAYGLILAWPLNVYNVFTDSPIAAWLVISFVQTFVAIPALIYFWGKGAYCGWICSCGALAETLGDTHRHKMPHGPRWNRLNVAGQAILGLAVMILLVRIYGWLFPAPGLERFFLSAKEHYKWIIDVFLAGVVGYGLYFWFSGRVWCRFFCPLAALMHIYARFSRFRILADKKKCISCNVCTSLCHQGIDIMNFANKGLPMEDPECVRCSACVQGCPTGVLSFGQVNRRGEVVGIDRLAASPLHMLGEPVKAHERNEGAHG
jgi:thioredoxin reductase/polyferredoxin